MTQPLAPDLYRVTFTLPLFKDRGGGQERALSAQTEGLSDDYVDWLLPHEHRLIMKKYLMDFPRRKIIWIGKISELAEFQTDVIENVFKAFEKAALCRGRTKVAEFRAEQKLKQFAPYQVLSKAERTIAEQAMRYVSVKEDLKDCLRAAKISMRIVQMPRPAGPPPQSAPSQL
ncbi:MAG: hypothetical protein JSS32_10390 [Verrucomicrobia bacterium]|nr:hypothetical protein [Verrucomicrobiota bacterium]